MYRLLWTSLPDNIVFKILCVLMLLTVVFFINVWFVFPWVHDTFFNADMVVGTGLAPGIFGMVGEV